MHGPLASITNGDLDPTGVRDALRVQIQRARFSLHVGVLDRIRQRLVRRQNHVVHPLGRYVKACQPLAQSDPERGRSVGNGCFAIEVQVHDVLETWAECRSGGSSDRGIVSTESYDHHEFVIPESSGLTRLQRGKRLVDRSVDTEQLVEADQGQRSTRRRAVRDHGETGGPTELLMRRRQERHSGRCEEAHAREIDDHRGRRLLEDEAHRLRQLRCRRQIELTGNGDDDSTATPIHCYIEMLGPEARIFHGHNCQTYPSSGLPLQRVIPAAHLASPTIRTRLEHVMTDRMPATVAVAVGGAVGAVLRFEIWRLRDTQRWLMMSTFVVDVAGCLLLGAALGYLSGRRSPVIRAAVLGVACGFTTFGFYALQGVTYDAAWHSVLYIVCTPIVSVAALGIGALITRPAATVR